LNGIKNRQIWRSAGIVQGDKRGGAPLRCLVYAAIELLTVFCEVITFTLNFVHSQKYKWGA
jgi:hypothetical protein